MQCRLIAATMLVLSGLPGAAGAETPGFAGRWRWNPEQSSMPPGEPAPRETVLVIERAEPAIVQWQLFATDESGAQHTESFKGGGDGKPAPVAGAPEGTTAAYTVTSAGVQIAYSPPGGGVDQSTCSLSPDGRKMTCKGMENDGKGNSEPYTDVYDRQ